tara:strand:+ start:89 stop:364 length:276 start_codon:yes stop_codon:yes gene_type:complete
MKESKLVRLVILYLSAGEKPRHKVTGKIKNYPKEEQAMAIKQLMESGYISLREGLSEGRGRTPAYISLTDKGALKSAGYSDEPTHKSIWAI